MHESSPTPRPRPERAARRVAGFGAILFLSLGAISAAIPPRSTERGERLDHWRAVLLEAETEVSQGRLEDGERLYRGLLASPDAGAGDLLLARAVDGLADLCRERDQHEEAVRLYVQSAELWENLLGPRQPRLATTLHNLGLAYRALGRRADARATLERALSIWEQTLGSTSPEAENTRRAIAAVAADARRRGDR